MFIDCPYCGYLVALDEQRGHPPARCPNCAQLLRDAPASADTQASARDAEATQAAPGALGEASAREGATTGAVSTHVPAAAPSAGFAGATASPAPPSLPDPEPAGTAASAETKADAPASSARGSAPADAGAGTSAPAPQAPPPRSAPVAATPGLPPSDAAPAATAATGTAVGDRQQTTATAAATATGTGAAHDAALQPRPAAAGIAAPPQDTAGLAPPPVGRTHGDLPASPVTGTAIVTDAPGNGVEREPAVSTDASISTAAEVGADPAQSFAPEAPAPETDGAAAIPEASVAADADAEEVPPAVVSQAAAAPAAPRARATRPAVPSFARAATGTPTDRKRVKREIAVIAALCLALALQLLLSQRARLAADAQWRPLLSSLCGALRCTLPPWREPGAFHVLERDVRAHAPGVLRVSARIRNDARWAQPWPALRLTLSDANGRAVASRLFQPREYLGGMPTQSQLGSGQTAALRMDIVEPGSQAVAFTFDFQ